MLKNEKNKEKLLNDVLKMEPSFSLPEDFASRLTLKVSSRMAFVQYLKEFFIYFFTIIGIGVIASGIIFYFISETWVNWIELAKSNSGMVEGLLFIILFILFADKVLLRYFYHSVSAKKTS